MKNLVSIMPCLDIREGRVVKGIHFADLIDAGDPVERARAYEESGADELGLLDIAATFEKRAPAFDVLRLVVSAVKIPVTIAGGIRSLADVEMALAAGAKKVGISSAAFRDPGFVAEAVKRFGGKTIVAAIDAAPPVWVKKARTERYPPSSTSDEAKRPTSERSFSAWAVQSTGFCGAQ